MSEYAKPKVLELINSNKYLLTKLKKFKHLNEGNNEYDFLNAMKIKIEDIKKVYEEYKQKNKILTFDVNKLQLINSNRSFPLNYGDTVTNDYIKQELELVKNDLVTKVIEPTTKFSARFYDFYDTLNIDSRKGSMSFSLCNNLPLLHKLYESMCSLCNGLSSSCACAQISKEDIPASVSLNPHYYSASDPKLFGRITYFTNQFKLCLYNFTSNNYNNRFIFRTMITKLILGDDYFDVIIQNQFKPTIGFFKDYTVGQEVYYYFLELYNYDRMNFIKNSFDNFFNSFNKGIFEKYYNNDDINNTYPPFDGVLYFDNSEYDNINYPGTECLLFNKEFATKIFGVKTLFNNKFYLAKDLLTCINDFINYIDNPPSSTNQNITNVCNHFNLETKTSIEPFHTKYTSMKPTITSLRTISMDDMEERQQLQRMDTLWEQSLTGGKYKNKYLKYKQKYLNLKINN